MTIVFCIPGSTISGDFFDCWNLLMFAIHNKGINPMISFQSSPVYHYARNATLGGDVLAGGDQIPFQGKLNYDYMIWIDPAISKFTPENVLNLIYHNKPIVAGHSTKSRIVKTWDDSIVTPQYMTSEEILSHDKPFPVDYTRVEFMSFKRGIIEQVKYPWFRPIYYRNKKVYEFNAEQENVDFCLQLKEINIPILIDPKIQVERS